MPAGRKSNKQNGSVPKVEGSRSAAGGQSTVQHIAGDGLAALALRLASGSFHGKAESLLDAWVVERSFNRFPW
jgi:hypothetical protein